MRVAIVVNSFPKLSETFILNKVLALRAAGARVTVIAHAPSTDRAHFADRLVGTDGLVELASTGAVFRAREWGHAMARPRATAALLATASRTHGPGARALRAIRLALPLHSRFDIVHFETSGLALRYADAFPLLRPARLMVSCRGSAERVAPVLDPARVEPLRAMFAQVDLVHCVSHDMQRTVLALGADASRCVVIHPAVDHHQFAPNAATSAVPDAAGPLRLVSTGRLHWVKALDVALEAMHQLVSAGGNVRYDIIGSGPEEERLRFTIHEHELQDHVRLLGALPPSQVRERLASADAFLLTSMSEGVSNAALEAMAMQLPVITTDVGGMSEAVTDEVNGFVVRPHDAAAIAQRIRQLQGDRTLLAAMGVRARKTVCTQFGLDEQVTRFLAAYERLFHLGAATMPSRETP